MTGISHPSRLIPVNVYKHVESSNLQRMGAVSPVDFADKEFMKKVEDTVIRRTVDGIKKEKLDYRGFIFAGLMNVNGEPYVI